MKPKYDKKAHAKSTRIINRKRSYGSLKRMVRPRWESLERWNKRCDVMRGRILKQLLTGIDAPTRLISAARFRRMRTEMKQLLRGTRFYPPASWRPWRV